MTQVQPPLTGVYASSFNSRLPNTQHASITCCESSVACACRSSDGAHCQQSIAGKRIVLDTLLFLQIRILNISSTGRTPRVGSWHFMAWAQGALCCIPRRPATSLKNCHPPVHTLRYTERNAGVTSATLAKRRQAIFKCSERADVSFLSPRCESSRHRSLVLSLPTETSVKLIEQRLGPNRNRQWNGGANFTRPRSPS